MTACVNRKHTKKAAAVVTASLVGALSLGVAPVAAMAEGIDMLESDQDAWKASTIKFTADADVNDNYSVAEGDTFAVESVTTVGGVELDSSDYSVAYFYKANIGDPWTPTNAKSCETLDQRNGGMPGIAGSYAVAIIEGKWTCPTSPSGNDWSISNVLDGYNYVLQEFSVTSTGDKTLGGAFAYEGTDIADKSFQYNGSQFTVSFAKGKTTLTQGRDYTVKWTALPVGEGTPSAVGTGFGITNAGTYTAELTGINDYKGSSATVTFTVAAIDLASDTITIEPSTDGFQSTAPVVTVNGKKITASGILNTRIREINDTAADGTTPEVGKYLIRVTPGSAAGDNVTGSYVDVETYNVDRTVTYTYDGKTLGNGSGQAFENAFNPTLNMGFDPDKLEAEAGSVEVGFTYKVLNSEGTEVSSWDEPGEYTLVLETPFRGRTSDGAYDSYYGSAQSTFTVAGTTTDYSGSKIYVSIDGKNVENGDKVSYTGEAFAPVWTVKNGKETLVESEDYTVAILKGDEEVSEIKDPGKYVIRFTYNDSDENYVDYGIEVKRAEIVTAEPTADFFATDGETAAAPSFIGSTDADFDKGVKFDLAADDISVVYYEASLDADGNPTGPSATEVDAEDLTEEGWYYADIKVLTTAEFITGDATCLFQVSETAGFEDVAADAWYADAVYQAKDLSYMTGIAGTKLFMPEAEITRAEIAQVFFNMAGQSTETGKYYPTQFGDVDGWAWYAQPVDWAARAGVVTGYDADTFGPTDKASRQQVAVMLYRYAKAQGKDVAVEDADAALAAYKDGDQVADWAKEAMAWAVENGVFGVDTDELYPTENIQRAAVAAITVRFQPEQLKK